MNRNRLLNSDRHPIRLVALLAAALLVAGCTAEGEALAPGQGDEPVEIAPTMTINGMEVSTTRAATDNGEKFYFSRCDETGVGTGVFGSYPGTTENLLEATRNSTTGALTFKTPQYYYTNGRKSRFIGFYPKETAIGAPYLAWEIDGTTDVLIATRLEGSKTDKGINTFNFKHRLTQLQFFPFAETADIAAQWGKITKIEMLVLSNTVYWDYTGNDDASGELIYPGDADMTVPGISSAAPAALPTGGKASATVQAGAATMICPNTAASYVLTLRITTEKLGTKTVTRKGALLENTPYRIYLRFTGQAIELAGFEQLSVEDWQTGANQSGTSGKTYPYVVGSNTIVSKDAKGQGANDIHANWINNDMPEHNESSLQALQVSAKFQVQEKDISVDGGLPNGYYAQTACKAPWRLPTIGEFQAIRAMSDRLVGVDAFAISDYYVGTRQAGDTNQVCMVSVQSGQVYHDSNDTYAYVRCIRDIE